MTALYAEGKAEKIIFLIKILPAKYYESNAPETADVTLLHRDYKRKPAQKYAILYRNL